MKKYIYPILSIFLIWGTIVDTVNAYSNTPRRIIHKSNQYYQYPQYNTQQTQYYDNSQSPRIIYIYQPQGYTSPYGRYPGCNNADIIIGGQRWASCNVLDKNTGSDAKSGWFFARDSYASFIGYNGFWARLEWMRKVYPDNNNWNEGPCAEWYRIPTRSEWETANYYARLNGVSINNLLNLPTNWSYKWNKDTNGDIILESRYDVNGAYWSSTFEYSNGYFPTVLHLGSTYQWYRTNGTDYVYQNSTYNWQYTDIGLILVAGTSSEMANIRCIRK
jgi:hypothetical protein